jgi:hypothetical protein
MSIFWTCREVRVLERHYPTASWSALRAMLPRRSHEAIKNKAQSMGLARAKSLWPQLIALLIIRNPGFSATEIARRVNCSEGRVRQVRRAMAAVLRRSDSPRPYVTGEVSGCTSVNHLPAVASGVCS